MEEKSSVWPLRSCALGCHNVVKYQLYSLIALEKKKKQKSLIYGFILIPERNSGFFFQLSLFLSGEEPGLYFTVKSRDLLQIQI